MQLPSNCFDRGVDSGTGEDAQHNHRRSHDKEILSSAAITVTRHAFDDDDEEEEEEEEEEEDIPILFPNATMANAVNALLISALLRRGGVCRTLFSRRSIDFHHKRVRSRNMTSHNAYCVMHTMRLL